MSNKDSDSSAIKIGRYLIDRLQDGQHEFAEEELMAEVGIKNKRSLRNSLQNGYRGLYQYKKNIIELKFDMFLESDNPKAALLNELTSLLSFLEKPTKSGVERGH